MPTDAINANLTPMASQALPPAGGEPAAQQPAAVPHVQLLHRAAGRVPAERVTVDAATLVERAQRSRCGPSSRTTSSFLLAVYASTREPELAAVPWDAAQKAAFVGCSSPRSTPLPGALRRRGVRRHPRRRPAGRAALRRPQDDEIRIVDIALLPEYCNRGIGTTLLRGLQAEAAAAGKPLRIHVERFNPALRLYERLGFRQVEDRGVYLFMEWTGG